MMMMAGGLAKGVLLASAVSNVSARGSLKASVLVDRGGAEQRQHEWWHEEDIARMYLK